MKTQQPTPVWIQVTEDTHIMRVPGGMIVQTTVVTEPDSSISTACAFVPCASNEIRKFLDGGYEPKENASDK